MKITINVQNPDGLKRRIVSDVENGNLSTWELRTNTKNDKLLTHSAEQWVDKVLLRLTPDTIAHQLLVEPRYWRDMQRPTEEEFGTVLGRFCERLFAQYSDVIDSFFGSVK